MAGPTGAAALGPTATGGAARAWELRVLPGPGDPGLGPNAATPVGLAAGRGVIQTPLRLSHMDGHE
jgi:hypothetical protein